MSSKDDFLFKKNNLIKTNSGRKILKKGLFRDEGYLQFKKYVELSKKEYDSFVLRFQKDIFELIESDTSPDVTHEKFLKEIDGSQGLRLELGKFQEIKKNLLRDNNLTDRIKRILNSNFIKMTFPVFFALFDGYMKFTKNFDINMRNDIIDGHLIAIDLSEPMDRIIDKDEDLEYLEDYKFLNPYILNLAKLKISKGGDRVFSEFENGFKNALEGQQYDYEMKVGTRELTYENIEHSYNKYRAILGTAGKNMSLNQKPLSEIYYIGMAKAAESVGCGNEIQDAIVTKGIKSPSWPLYYSMMTTSVTKGFKLTLDKGFSYLSEANSALYMLDDNFEIKPFLNFLFLTVSHYNEYWYQELVQNRGDLMSKFQNDIDKKIIKS
ncbi:MAG TPA: hypothetical protein VIY08_06090 [Candidatus Nitrosocosmicus sp.]